MQSLLPRHERSSDDNGGEHGALELALQRSDSSGSSARARAAADPLDAVVDGLRGLLAHDTSASVLHVDAALSASLTTWLEILVARTCSCEALATPRRQQQQQAQQRGEQDPTRNSRRQLDHDACGTNGAAACATGESIASDRSDSDSNSDGYEDAEDVVDVFAMLLVASARNRWRERLLAARHDDDAQDPFHSFVFQPVRMQALLRLLERLTSSRRQSVQPESVLTVCEVIHSLGRLAQTNEEVATMIDAWRSAEVLFSAHAPSMWQAVHSLEMSDWQRLSVCYARFVSDRCEMAVALQPMAKTSAAILHHLIGNTDTAQWRRHTWEQAWHRINALDFCERVFGSSSDCHAMVLRILRGFAVPQVDADAAHALDLAPLLRTLDLEALAGLRHGVDVTLVRDGLVHPAWHTGDVLPLDSILSAFDRKYTIGIRGVHARSECIAHVCRTLQDELQQHVNANIYWTPPGEQGFTLHVDDHCVFVVQLKGRKHWRLKPRGDTLPSLYSELLEPTDAGPTDEIVLERGDVLYIPRGTPHCAHTRGLDEDSIHVTIGVEVEAQFTKQALVLELLASRLGERASRTSAPELELIQDALEANARRAQLRGGLMAWHLEDPSALNSEVEALLDSVERAISDLAAANGSDRATKHQHVDAALLTSTQRLVQDTRNACTSGGRELAAAHKRLLAERQAFLLRRANWSHAFAQLHRYLESDEQPPLAPARRSKRHDVVDKADTSKRPRVS